MRSSPHRKQMKSQLATKFIELTAEDEVALTSILLPSSKEIFQVLAEIDR